MKRSTKRNQYLKKNVLKDKKEKNYFKTQENFQLLKEILEEKKKIKKFPYHGYTQIFQKLGVDPIAFIVALIVSKNNLQIFLSTYVTLLVIIHVPLSMIRAHKMVKHGDKRKK